MGNYIVKVCSCQEKNEATNTTTEFRIVKIFIKQGRNNQQDTLKDEFKTNICESKLTPTEVVSINCRNFMKGLKKEHLSILI
jgi:hypothetical protein